MYSKKAQIAMIELLMVLVILGILIGLGVYVYFTFFISSVRDTEAELEVQESNTLLAFAAGLPELQCSQRTDPQNCIDTIKLLSVMGVIKDNPRKYSELFGNRGLSVEVIYPEVSNVECSQVTYPNCKLFKLFDSGSGKKISVPMPLYYPITGTSYVGRLILEVVNE